MTFTILQALEWTGAILGLLGSYTLATNTRISRYGWIAFFLANIAMILFAAGTKHYGLLVQQLGFTGSSLLGMHRTGFFTHAARDSACNPTSITPVA